MHALPPEMAHNLGLWALKKGLLPSVPTVEIPSLATRLWGLYFSNPVGLAAGFDKNAEAVDALLRQGFGFVEAGTVTPLPQPGNPRPRVFRLTKDKAVINRLGFNNEGLDVFVKRLTQRKEPGIVGANIGKNKDSPDATADYVTGLSAVYPHADYVTMNISSPNTEGLRALQQRAALEALLEALQKTRAALHKKHDKHTPLLIKIAPDLGQKELADIVELTLAFGIDGLIISNTTIARPPSLASTHKAEQGGLSGKPLLAPSTEVLKNCYRLSGGKLPLIGCGGIFSGADAYVKIRAGASLVQLYTALVYQGFSLVEEIKTGLAELLRRDGLTHISQAIGKDA